MRLRDRLIKGTTLNLIAVVFNQGSTLFVNIIVARLLMKQGFGEYAMVQSTLLTVSMLSQLATGYTASKYVAEYRSVDPERAGRIMGVCAAVSVVMAAVGTVLLIVMAPWLAETMLNAPHLALALMIGSGFLFFSSINGYQTGALAGLEAYGSLAKAGVASGMVAVVVIALGTWWGGLNGAFVGLGVSAFIRCAIHNRWLWLESRIQGIKPQYRGSLNQEKAVILNYALPAAIAGYYSMPMFWLANSFLVRQSDGYGEMAFYVAATNIKSVLLFMPSVMNSVTSSLLNNIKGNEKEQQYENLFKFNILVTFLISSITAFILGVFGDFFLEMFGNNFIAAKPILLIVLVSGVFESTAGAIYQRIQSHGMIWLSLFFMNIPVVFLFVITAYFVVPSMGAFGLGVASLVMTLLQFFITKWLAYYIAKKKPLVCYESVLLTGCKLQDH